MPVLSFVSSKGGAGKTTTCVVIATELARYSTVCIIDVDKMQRSIRWSQKTENLPENISIKSCLDKKELAPMVRAADATFDYVLIDTKGDASELNSLVIAESDLVIVPLKDDQQAADDTIFTVDEIKAVSFSYRREIPFRLLFNNIKQVGNPKLSSHINAELRSEYPSFKTELKERPAFNAMMHFGGGLANIPSEITGVDAATENAFQVVSELTDILAKGDSND
ncbi:ParA family protein [Sulfitobacter sp. M22]|uniref:ParA family protein n=1 Tax=Sulfitobacter sp. M22 TaxID=2675332 RepID=UPI001F2720DE|nr:ParA family protein [Sulfitobacter sp. M22]MCF7728682.1 AAA family ATPase [Sulfitobacter sp. M22]